MIGAGNHRQCLALLTENRLRYPPHLARNLALTCPRTDGKTTLVSSENWRERGIHESRQELSSDATRTKEVGTVSSKEFPGSITTRRQLLAAFGAQLALSSCNRLIGPAAGTCPENPADSGGIGWIPDIAHPVFYGVQNFTPSQGAPRNMQIYYPGARFRNPPLLKMCLARWPVVLFLHGMPPLTSGFRQPWAHAWWRLPSTIAQAGYVVVVPEHSPNLVLSDPDLAVNNAARDLEWVMNEWSEARWLDKRPTSTVIAGHSFGALIATRFAAQRQVGALVGLSGTFIRENETLAILKTVTVPTFLMWAQGVAFEDLHARRFWETELKQNRYAAVFSGEHFDYVEASDSGPTPRGACAHVGGVAGDFAALFIASTIQSLTAVHVDLRKPQPLMPLTAEQQVFANGYLNNLDFFSPPNCGMTLEWRVGEAAGARQFGALI